MTEPELRCIFVSRELISIVGGSSVESDEDVECALIYSTIRSQHSIIIIRIRLELEDISSERSIEAGKKELLEERLAIQERSCIRTI